MSNHTKPIGETRAQTESFDAIVSKVTERRREFMVQCVLGRVPLSLSADNTRLRYATLDIGQTVRPRPTSDAGPRQASRVTQRMRFVIGMGLAWGQLVLLPIGHGILYGQTERIDQQWQVQDVGFGTKPSFDFDSQGRLHVMGMTEDFDGVVWYANAESIEGPWDPQVVNRGYFYGPGDLRVDPSGAAHLAWHDHDVEDPNHLTVTPQGVSTLFRIPTPGHNGWDNALALDRSGRVYQSSVNPSQFGATASLEFGSFDGSTWTYETVANSGSFAYGLNTSLAIDGENQPHAVYCLCDDWATPGQLNYAHRDGNEWTVDTIATDGIRGRFPVVAIDDADRPHVAWVDIDENDPTRGLVQYAVLENDAWAIDTIDTLENIQLGFGGARKLVSMAIDSGGDPHLAYGTQRAVRYAARSEDDWTTTTVLETSQSQYNGLVVMRLDPQDNPGIVFWQNHPTEAGLVRIAAPLTSAAPALQAGDANQDFEFNQLDLFQVLRVGKWRTGQPATWGEGDWDGAPGGSVGDPPTGDGVFSQSDIIAALNSGTYLTGTYAASAPGPGNPSDEQTSITDHADTGEVAVDARTSVELTSISMESAAGVIADEASQNLGGSFDDRADENTMKAIIGSSFDSLSSGDVAQAGLSDELRFNDLTVVASLAVGGDLGEVDLVNVPEPESALLLALGLVFGLVCVRCVGCSFTVRLVHQ